MVEDGAKVLEFPKPKAVAPMPPVTPPRKPEPKEHYRVGYIPENGMTTLTLIADYGNSMTLSMNREACEAMIKMLRATYPDTEDDIDPDDPDGGLPIEDSEARVA